MNMYEYTDNNNNTYLVSPVQQQQHHHQHHQIPGTSIPMYHQSPLTGLEHLTVHSPTHSDARSVSPTAPSEPATFYDYNDYTLPATTPSHPGSHDTQYHYAGFSRDTAIPVDPRRAYLQPSPIDTSFEAPVAGPSRRQPTRRVETHPYLSTSVPRRRPHSHLQMHSSDDEELEDLPPNATDQQKLNHQRQRNTLAARRSRKRKELYRQELEQRVDELTMETEKWKTRAEMLRRIIENQGLGLVCPEWSE